MNICLCFIPRMSQNNKLCFKFFTSKVDFGVSNVYFGVLRNRKPFGTYSKLVFFLLILPLQLHISICLSISTDICTICPRSSDPFYMITYYMKWVTTSWTAGINKFVGNTSMSKV